MPRQYGTAVVADRHHQMLRGVHSLLGEMFDAVVMVADDRSLVEAVDRMRPDLVVVDISLRNSTDDLSIARWLVSGRPHLRVIVLSVHDEPAAVKQTLRAGAAGFVLKRTAAADLVPAVHDVLAGRSYVSPAARAGASPASSSEAAVEATAAPQESSAESSAAAMTSMPPPRDLS